MAKKTAKFWIDGSHGFKFGGSAGLRLVASLPTTLVIGRCLLLVIRHGRIAVAVRRNGSRTLQLCIANAAFSQLRCLGPVQSPNSDRFCPKPLGFVQIPPMSSGHYVDRTYP